MSTSLHASLPGLLSAVQTADSGSFTAAGRVLDLTPAAVSKNVALLEARLGVRLFNRTTRQLSLTEEGRRFVAQARDGLHLLEAAAVDATEGSAARGCVRVSCAVAFGRRFVLPQLGAFFERYPQVQVDLSLSDQVVDLVREGFDIGIRGGIGPPEGMVARPICGIVGLLTASPQYLQAHGTPRSWEALRAHRLIGLRFHSGTAEVWTFRKGGRTYALEPPSALTVSDPEAAVDAAIAGLGIASATQHHAWAALQDGRLLPVLAHQHRPRSMSMALFYPHRRGLASRVRVLADHLMAGFAREPALQARASTAARTRAT